MAEIREVLTLVDNFSNTFSVFNQAANAAMQSSVELANAVRELAAGANTDMSAGANSLKTSAEGANQALSQAHENQNKVTQATNATVAATHNWMGAIRSIITMLGGGMLVKTFIETSDTMSQITAKFNLITESAEQAAQLQNDIFSAAQRSRGSYEAMASSVTKLRMNAGNVFKTNEEAVAFAEKLQKTFKVAGTTQAEMASATLQLTQALGSGALRGEEFRAVYEAAPMIMQRIADEMGKPVEQMKELASEGAITSDIIKRAMLSSKNDIEEAFNELPLTFADIIQRSKNTIEMSMQGAFQNWNQFLNAEETLAAIDELTQGIIVLAQIGGNVMAEIGSAALWLRDNFEYFLPVLSAVAGMFIALKIQALGAALATAKGWAIAHWEILLIGALIAGVVAIAIYSGTKMEDIGRGIGKIWGWLYAFGYNIVADAYNLIVTFAEFFANVWNDPLNAVTRLFVGVFDVILSIVETAAAAIDAVLKTNMSGAVANFRANLKVDLDNAYGEQKVHFDRMDKFSGAETRDLMEQFGDVGAGLGSKLDNFLGGMNDLVNSADATSNAVAGAGEVGSVGSVGKIKGDVKLSDEDLKYYRNIAEAKYMQKIEVNTLQPQVNISVENGKDLKAEDISDMVTATLIEQANNHTAIAYS